MSRKLTGDSWSYSFSSFKIIEGTFNILKGIYDANGSVHTKTLSSWINEVTDGKEDSPRKFLVDLRLIKKSLVFIDVKLQGFIAAAEKVVISFSANIPMYSLDGNVFQSLFDFSRLSVKGS